MQEGRRIASIQFLRFVAAFLVVVSHICEVMQRVIAPNFPYLDGRSGVDVFFVISGFIIAYTAQNCDTASEFMLKRICRVVPLYWMLTLGVCLIVLLAPQLLHTTTVDFEQFLKSLFFIPYRRESGLLQPILYVGWTLNYEMFFYVMFALGMAASTRPVVVVTALFVALATVGYVFNPSSVLGEFCTAPIILEFVAGMWIYEFYRRRDFRPARGLSLLLPLGLGILFVQLFWPANLGREIAFGIPGALAVLGAVSWPMGTNSLTLFAVVLGNASYSLYLSHPYGINAIAALAKRFLDASPVTIVAIIMLMLAITVISALLLYKYFERPSNRWLSARLISPKRQSTAAAEAA